MANYIVSPNMNLVIPSVGKESGPLYASDVNSSLTLLDQHDHSLGKGVQITPAGLNINADLTLNDNQLTDVKSILFEAQDSNLTDIQSLYVAPGSEVPTTNDLWYNDGNGVQVQLTKNGLVNATIASLPGESYAAGTFTWRQGDGSTVPANFDIGSIIIRPNVAGTTFGVQLQPNPGISSQYDISLPLLPVAQSFLTIDNLGVMTAATPFAGGIVTANIADNAVTTPKIQDGAVTHAKLADDAVVFSSQIITTSSTIFAPARATMMWAYIYGGGGGGGAGGNASGRASGGGGGGSAVPILFAIKITPGSSVNVVVGAAGTGGVTASGGNGGTGGTTVLTVGGNSYTVNGGSGGGVGADGGGGGGGGAAPAGARAGILFANGGSSGNSGANGSTGQGNSYYGGGTGGTGVVNGGGGGGGGAPGFLGIGGGGGAGGNAGVPGSSGGGAGNPGTVPPVANSGAGGGGGGGASGGSGPNTGGNGSAGRGGAAIIFWQT